MSVFSYQQINLPMSYALFLQRFTAAASGIVQVTSFGPDDDPYMEMNVRPIVVDRYDFPADAAPGATGPLVDSEELRMLHDYGLAQEFDIWGVGSTHEFSWNGFHERATLESSIDFEKAPRFVDTHNLGNRATEPLNDLDLGTTPVDTNW